MKYTVEPDGDMWFAHYEDFANLQESLAEFGDTPISALQNFIKSENNMNMTILSEIKKVKDKIEYDITFPEPEVDENVL
jgi:hypothetical protein